MPLDDAGTPTKKRANGLVAASCAGVLAVYSAGYFRTKSAVDRFEAQAAERRAAFPDSSRIVGRVDARRDAMRTEAATAEPRKNEPSMPPRDEPPAFRALEPPAPPPEALAPPAMVPSAEAKSEKAAVAEPPMAVIPAQSAESITPAPVTPAAAASESFLPAPVPASPQIAAPAAAPPSPAALNAAQPKWKDGSYLGWGTSRHGNIQAEVIVQQGRILSATIAQCRTRYSCSVIDRLPPQVAQRQSPDVDYVSGATQSANAFYFAVVDALSKAQ